MIERTYIVPLRQKTQTASVGRRAKKAIFVLKEFITKHMKSENVKVSEKLNELIWENGMQNPPSKVKIIATKDEKEDAVHVRLFGEAAPVAKAPKEKKDDAPKTKLQEQVAKAKEALAKKDAKPKEEAAKPAEKKEDAKVADAPKAEDKKTE